MRNVRLLYIHNFLTDFRFQFVFLVIYFNQITGSYLAAMAILALETIVAAVMDIPTGMLSDRIGRKYTLVMASACATVSAICYAFAGDIILLAVGAVAMGLSQCLFSGNNAALLYETLKAEGEEGQFHHYQGRTGSMFQLALGLSALAGSFLTGFGLQAIFILSIIPQALAVGVGLLFVEPRVHVNSQHSWVSLRDALSLVWHNPRLRLLVMGQAISYGAGEAGFNAKTAFINMLWPTWALGIYRALNHALGFVGFWLAGRIVERVKPPHVLAVCESYWFVTQGLAILMANSISPLLMLTGAGFYGPFIVARDKLLQQEFTDAQRATMGSIASFAGSIMFAIVALGTGLIADHIGVAAGVGFSVVVCVFSLPFYIALFRRYF